MSLKFIQEPLDKTPPALPPTQSVTLNVNGEEQTLQIAPWTTLLDALREHLDLTGTKKGCDHGQCGACTVLLDGKRINSCLALATVCQGKKIETIEGLGTEENLSPLQQAFVDLGSTVSHHHAVGTEHQPWLTEDIGEGGVRMIQGLFESSDPGRNLNPGKVTTP